MTKETQIGAPTRTHNMPMRASPSWAPRTAAWKSAMAVTNGAKTAVRLQNHGQLNVA